VAWTGSGFIRKLGQVTPTTMEAIVLAIAAIIEYQ
jgi:hypothetical protein